MTRHLNLVQSDFEQLEKRVLPRFPFCYLTFKCSKNSDHVFEVKDISNSGMQIALRDGTHSIENEATVSGKLHWTGTELEISGTVKWVTDMRLGVEFSGSAALREKIDQFLQMENFASNLRPLHKMDHAIDMPINLKSWLRADGPVEVFVWQHNDGELEKFQILMMENFLEWVDGKGVKTARVISKRDINTPLITEDEYVFKLDPSLDSEKLAMANKLIENVADDLLDQSVKNFILRKLKA